jgi:hypothetical protein
VIFLRSLFRRTTSPGIRFSTNMILSTVEFVVGMVGSQRPWLPMKEVFNSTEFGYRWNRVHHPRADFFFDVFGSSYDSP